MGLSSSTNCTANRNIRTFNGRSIFVGFTAAYSDDTTINCRLRKLILVIFINYILL